MYAKFYKDLLKNNTFMAIKTSIPTCIFQHGRHLHFGEMKISFSTLAHTSLLLCILMSLRNLHNVLENTRPQTNVQKTLFIILFA